MGSQTNSTIGIYIELRQQVFPPGIGLYHLIYGDCFAFSPKIKRHYFQL